MQYTQKYTHTHAHTQTHTNTRTNTLKRTLNCMTDYDVLTHTHTHTHTHTAAFVSHLQAVSYAKLPLDTPIEVLCMYSFFLNYWIMYESAYEDICCVSYLLDNPIQILCM